jgi:lipid II isoglutaminyl synthase (glutamine-hydrolysing)
MFRAKLLLARLVRALARASGRSGGTTAPGRILLRLEPHAIERLGSRLRAGVALVSATNGKTTTASMLASILERSGKRLVRNRAGSNMHWGVATALLDVRAGSGELGLFEVDEAWLPPVTESLDPTLVLLSNLFRDQLDRYGELELLADRWDELVAARTAVRDSGSRAGGTEPPASSSTFVLNADDPLIADLGRGRDRIVYFGISDDSQALPELQHAADSKHCRNCGTPYAYDAVYLGHLGRYRCPGCGRSRPEPAVAAERIALQGMSGSRLTLRTPGGTAEVVLRLPGLYNVYNAVAATAAALELGASLDDVRAGLEEFAGAFGRVETVQLDGREVSILLVKNPAGANEVLRTLMLEDRPLDLWLALNDRIADGRDVSWIWDADFELLAGRVRRAVCSGSRAEEMALRLKYAGVTSPIEVDRDLGDSLDRAVTAADGGPVYALPTYTALLDLRDLLTRRGAAPRWSQ